MKIINKIILLLEDNINRFLIENNNKIWDYKSPYKYMIIITSPYNINSFVIDVSCHVREFLHHHAHHPPLTRECRIGYYWRINDFIKVNCIFIGRILFYIYYFLLLYGFIREY